MTERSSSQFERKIRNEAPFQTRFLFLFIFVFYKKKKKKKNSPTNYSGIFIISSSHFVNSIYVPSRTLTRFVTDERYSIRGKYRQILRVSSSRIKEILCPGWNERTKRNVGELLTAAHARFLFRSLAVGRSWTMGWKLFTRRTPRRITACLPTRILWSRTLLTTVGRCVFRTFFFSHFWRVCIYVNVYVYRGTKPTTQFPFELFAFSLQKNIWNKTYVRCCERGYLTVAINLVV